MTWAIEPNDGLDTAWISVGDGQLHARGRAVGRVPEPYWLTYELATEKDYVTSRIVVTAEKADGVAVLELVRDVTGLWTANGTALPDMSGALDCDLGLCPLTNSMPMLRHGLHRGPGRRDFVMAWISVPDLAIHRSEQTYEHLRLTDAGAVVWYTSGPFSADLEVDRDGIVARYPRLGYRLD